MSAEQIGQLLSVIIAVLGSVAGAKKLQNAAPPPVGGAVCPTCGHSLS